MTLKRFGKFMSNIYPSWIGITTSERNQEAALYPEELTSALLIQRLSQVHLHMITGVFNNFSQSVSLFRPYPLHCSASLTIVFFTGLQQISIQSILRQCVFWQIILSIDERNLVQFNHILRFHSNHVSFRVVKLANQSIQMLNPSC